MSLGDLLTVMRQRPFEPFLLHLDNGSAYEVRHPEQVLPTQTALFVGVTAQAEPNGSDRVDRVSLAHVTRLQPLPARQG